MFPTKKRLLFLAEANSLAHVVRPLVLANSLDADQYDIHFACAPGFEFALGDTGFTCHNIDSISVQQFIDALAAGQRLYDYPTLRRYIAADRDLIQEIKPDLVVGDFRLSLTVSAPAEGVPHMAICNGHWSPYAHPRFPMPELPMVKWLGIPLSEIFFKLGRPFVFRHHLAPLNRHRREHGLCEFDKLGAAYTHGDQTLLCDVPGLVPSFDLPTNHYYIGPLVWSPQTPMPTWWDELDGGRPTLYLTPGSTGKVDILPELIGALAALPVNLLVATAGRAQLGALPDNVFTSDYLPGEAAAARSALVICNGGSATVYQALAQGTPVLGLASNMDQFLTMGYVEKSGAGRLLRAGHASAETIGNVVQQMLQDDGCRQAAQSVAGEFRRFPAAELFPPLVNRLL